MKKVVLIIHFLVFLLSCKNSESEIIPIPFVDYGQLPAKENFDSVWRYNAFPTIAKLSNEIIVCVFYQGYAHISIPGKPQSIYEKGGRIMISYSYNKGKSWSVPKVFIDTNLDDRDPNISILKNEKVIISFFKMDSRFKPQGMTISEGINSSSLNTKKNEFVNPEELKLFLSSSPVRQLSNGDLILGLYKIGIGTGAVTSSHDFGRSWEVPYEIPNENGADLESETDIIELNDGTLFAALRASWDDNMHYALSYDFGKTWGNASDIGFKGQAPFLFKNSDGLIFLAYRGENGTTLRFSKDECKTWGKEYLISSSMGAYPSIVKTGEDEVLVAYYEEGIVKRGGDYVESVIRFKKINLKDIQ